MPMLDPTNGQFLNTHDLYGHEGDLSIKEAVERVGGAQSDDFVYAFNTAGALHLLVQHIHLVQRDLYIPPAYGDHGYELALFIPGQAEPLWSAVFRTIGRVNSYLKLTPGFAELLQYYDFKPLYWRWQTAAASADLPAGLAEYARRLRVYDEAVIAVR